jgi:hypothetical protein
MQLWLVLVGLVMAAVAREDFADQLSEPYNTIVSPVDDDEGFVSTVAQPPPKVIVDNVAWDPATMPLPDPNLMMPTGPDRTFRPLFKHEDQLEAGPVHVTRRNMVFPGAPLTDMETLSRNIPDIHQSAPQDYLQRIEATDTSAMPITPGM